MVVSASGIAHATQLRYRVATNNKSSAVAEMGDSGHNRHGPTRGRGLLCPFLRGRSAGSPSDTVAWAEAYLRTKWYPDASNRLATTMKSNMSFRLVPKSVTLIDRERRNGP